MSRLSLKLEERGQASFQTEDQAPVAITIVKLWTYPVKSMRHLEHQSITLSPWGLDGDRQYMVVDAQSGKFMTQRKFPQLSAFQPQILDGQLHITHLSGSTFAISSHNKPKPTQVTVWRYQGPADDCGDDAAAWLSEHLKHPARLVRVPQNFERRCNPAFAPKNSPVAFADGYPFLIASEQSLDSLNQRLKIPVPMERFRPNIVISSAEPSIEDRTHHFSFGNISLLSTKPCVRCVIVQRDHQTGELLGKEPLKTLSSYRMNRTLGGPTFGMNAVLESLLKPTRAR